MGRLAPGCPKALGKARRAARAGRPGQRRNAAQRLAPPRPVGWSRQNGARRVARLARGQPGLRRAPCGRRFAESREPPI